MRQLMSRVEKYKHLKDDWLQRQSPTIKSFPAERFCLKATKGLKDIGVGSTNGGSERGIQGASTQDRGPDKK